MACRRQCASTACAALGGIEPAALLPHALPSPAPRAPHSKEEKERANPPFGIANLETTLPLLLTVANQNKITFEEIIRLCHTNPAKIFNLNSPSPVRRGQGEVENNQKDSLKTYIEVDENEEWTVDSSQFFTKCKTSPYNGMRLKGKIKKVILHDTKVFEYGKILAKPGTGKILNNL